MKDGKDFSTIIPSYLGTVLKYLKYYITFFNYNNIKSKKQCLFLTLANNNRFLTTCYVHVRTILLLLYLKYFNKQSRYVTYSYLHTTYMTIGKTTPHTYNILVWSRLLLSENGKTEMHITVLFTISVISPR